MNGYEIKFLGQSSFYLNENTVIDAGNLKDALGPQSIAIENIYLTHSHLDHIVDIAYILDDYYMMRTKTLNIFGLPQTLNAVKEHFLNDIIWPDFSNIRLKDQKNYAVRYIPIEINKKYMLSNEEHITAFQTNHSVESCGYIYMKHNKGVMITSDTLSLSNALEIINDSKEIKSLIVECSFSSKMKKLALQSKHLTPKLLFTELKKLNRDDISIFVNHLKIEYEEKIKSEIADFRAQVEVNIVKNGEIIHFG